MIEAKKNDQAAIVATWLRLKHRRAKRSKQPAKKAAPAALMSDASESELDGDTVEVHYTGWLTDGTKFDSSRDRGQTTKFGVNQVISGWTEGLKLMTPGMRCKFIIPGDLAYGAQGRPPKIPANATLVFDVELVDVISMPASTVGPSSGVPARERRGHAAACGRVAALTRGAAARAHSAPRRA